MKCEPYLKYRETGIEWLGRIPEHWSSMKIRRLSPVKRGASPRPIDDPIYFDEAGEYSWVRIADVTASSSYLLNTTQRLSELGKSLSVPLEPGDIFLSIAGSVGKPIITRIKCCIHDGFVYFPKYKEDKRFLYYVFSSEALFFGLGKLGTQLNLNTDTVGDIWIGIPSPSEQRDIVAFLDREMERIDSLIAKKERQIALLKERRAALISHTVAKGPNPDAKMRDSGIEWLGEIPEHWKVHKLKHIASVIYSNVDKNSVAGEKSVRLCNYTDVYNNDYIRPELNLMEATASPAEITKFKLKMRDVLVTKDSEDWRDIAVSAFVVSDMDDVLCGYHLGQIRPNSSVVQGEYLFRAFSARGLNDQFRVAATGITRYGLGKYWLDNSIFLIPPIDEQSAIATFLDQETEQIDALIEKVQKSINMLHEYRTALISAAVTGKIDVRKDVA